MAQGEFKAVARSVMIETIKREMSDRLYNASLESAMIYIQQDKDY